MNKYYNLAEEIDNECLIGKPYKTTLSNKFFIFLAIFYILTSTFDYMINNKTETSNQQPTEIILAYNTTNCE